VAAVNLAALLEAAGLPGGEPEFRFHPTRRWRWDWAWAQSRPPLALEIDGGLFIRGRHSRGAGQEADMEKRAAGLLLGWRILIVSPRMLQDGRALAWLEQLLNHTLAYGRPAQEG
jgi:hypothetical protein